MTLRLIKPSTGGPSTRPPKGRRSPALSLTVEEARHLRTTIKNTARAYGGMSVLASVTGLSPRSLTHAAYNKRRRLSAGLALLIARAAGVSVEATITSALSEVGRCAACGSRVGDRRPS